MEVKLTYHNFGLDEDIPITQDIINEFQSNQFRLAVQREIIINVAKLNIKTDFKLLNEISEMLRNKNA